MSPLNPVENAPTAGHCEQMAQQTMKSDPVRVHDLQNDAQVLKLVFAPIALHPRYKDFG